MIAPASIALGEEDFSFIRDFVYRNASIVLEDDKRYLVEYRLAPLIQREGMQSFQHLVSELRQPAAISLRRRVVDAMTTNETYFFRDIRPFDVLRQIVLPQLIERRRPTRTLNFFFAGCSSGQEPYSIAMLLRHNFPELIGWNIRLTAVDLSSEMIRRAREGRYSQFEVNRGLPARMLVDYFKKDGLDWRISDQLRSMIDFREANLTDAFDLSGTVDLLFLRNVLIYFDQACRGQLLENVRMTLRPDGCVMLGAAETTVFASHLLVPLPIEHSNLFYCKDRPVPFQAHHP